MMMDDDEDDGVRCCLVSENICNNTTIVAYNLPLFSITGRPLQSQFVAGRCRSSNSTNNVALTSTGASKALSSNPYHLNRILQLEE